MKPGFNDIERYVAGAMSQREQHEFEKAMLDDPFLAEAVEGYLLQQDTIQARKDLQQLEQQLAGGATTVHRMPVRPNRWMQVAAGLAVLLMAAVVLVRLFGKEEEKVVINPADTETDTVAQLPPAVTTPDSQALAVLETKAPPISPGAIKMVPVVPGTTSAEEAIAAAAPAPQPTVASAPVTAAAKEDAAPTKLYRFSGRVTDATNTPLPYANIKEKTSGVGTYADHDGYFSLIAPDSVIEVETKSLGHHPQALKLQANTNQRIVMDDASGLANTDKRLLLERSRQKREKPAATIYETESLEPEYGFNSYTLYVANNLRRTEGLEPTKNKNREVEVSFDVLPDGSLANFKIERSDCSRCNLEAIRLLKEGPRWKSDSGKTTRTRYTVRF